VQRAGRRRWCSRWPGALPSRGSRAADPHPRDRRREVPDPCPGPHRTRARRVQGRVLPRCAAACGSLPPGVPGRGRSVPARVRATDPPPVGAGRSRIRPPPDRGPEQAIRAGGDLVYPPVGPPAQSCRRGGNGHVPERGGQSSPRPDPSVRWSTRGRSGALAGPTRAGVYLPAGVQRSRAMKAQAEPPGGHRPAPPRPPPRGVRDGSGAYRCREAPGWPRGRPPPLHAELQRSAARTRRRSFCREGPRRPAGRTHRPAPAVPGAGTGLPCGLAAALRRLARERATERGSLRAAWTMQGRNAGVRRKRA
jgi:hypothetical protein